MMPESSPFSLAHGEQGTVCLGLPELSQKLFTYAVSHINESGVGLHIINASENFATLLSKALSKELQPNTKKELDWSIVQITIHKPGAPPLQGKVLRLASDWIEVCCLPTHKGKSLFAIGETVNVHLTIPNTDSETLRIQGFVVEPLRLLMPKKGCPDAKNLHKIAFASGPMENVQQLVGLIRQVHTPKIKAIVQHRALTNTLLSKEETSKPSRSDTRHNIRRFFGHLWPKQ